MAIVNHVWNMEHFQLKYKNAAQWDSSYVLAEGEVGLEIDTGKAKLGDGTTAWGELDYYSDPVLQNLISQLTDRMTTAEGNITSLQSDMTDAQSRIAALEGQVQDILGVTTISVNAEPAAQSGE